MPIRATERDRYPPDWKKISHAARERAGNRCEQCKAPNGEYVIRFTTDQEEFSRQAYMLSRGQVFDAVTGDALGFMRGSDVPPNARWTRIILTVAHLDHQPENCAPENLRALCQRCHLAYDADLHKANAAATRRAKKATGDLFDTPAVCPAPPAEV